MATESDPLGRIVAFSDKCFPMSKWVITDHALIEASVYLARDVETLIWKSEYANGIIEIC